jgi:DNA polymerase II
VEHFEGWLFDVNELGPIMVLWIYLLDGRLVRYDDLFQPRVYARADRAGLKKTAAALDRRGIISSVRWTEKQEFWSGDLVEVLELTVKDCTTLPRLRNFAASITDEITFYNCDLQNSQYYLYTRGLFPLCHVKGLADQGYIVEIETSDSPWQEQYSIPQLKTVELSSQNLRPNIRDGSITLTSGEDFLELYPRDGEYAIEQFNLFFERTDPDLIISDYGDTIILPALLKMARYYNKKLFLDRDRVATDRKIETEGKSYFTYGKVIYKGPSYPLFGRWHVDKRNSFIFKETGLEGLIELSRLSKIPVQRMARTSPGTAMTSMQLDRAVNDNILIPWHKSEPESLKTALELLTIDKGGLVFQPPVGAHENITEIDFASMYPTIMAVHNISPETVLCNCCQNSLVPEAGYNICTKREGLIPRTLKPLIERRKILKRLLKETKLEAEREIYDNRRTAIKWKLVSCFGYLGYKNAKFGRIEAHEAVTAFGRECLIQSKEISEAKGFRLLHAITDSLWLSKENTGEEELIELCDDISRATGIEMSLEGLYRWIAFLPSKVNLKRPVPARFFGLFTDGKMKIRGLACRKSDTPQFIKEFQMKLLRALLEAKNLEECQKLCKEFSIWAEKLADDVRAGNIEAEQLQIRKTLIKEPDEYIVKTRTVLAARELQSQNISVHAGEKIKYIIRRSKSDTLPGISMPEYDVGEYLKLLKDATGEILDIFKTTLPGTAGVPPAQ